MNEIRDENFRTNIKTLWAFAAQHAAEMHQRNYFDEDPCEHEFASVVLMAVKDPENA